MFCDYDEELLEQISDGVDLVEYAGTQMELEKRGDEYFAHCPKHTDKTASLSFTPATNKYYCFSCGRGGGIINYLIQYEGLSFDEAIKKASKLAGVDTSKMCQSKTISFLKKLRSIGQKNDEYTHKILDESQYDKYSQEPIVEWEDEGINSDVMKIFDVRIDHNGNRIVYPVRDEDGNLINVKGRTRFLKFKEMKLPKYINYYEVGCMDYLQGLNVTKEFIKEKKEVIVFESIKSVMKAYGWGYKNCVSAEKHSLTKQQIEKLLRLKSDIVFAYDADVSYKDKTVREDLIRLKKYTNVYIIDDPNGLLGGVDSKNAPVDLGKDVWETLYKNKRRVI